MEIKNEISEQRLLATLGLCVRAGKVIFGVPMICDAMRKGGTHAPILILEAKGTSDNTHKRLTDKAAYYRVEWIRLSCDGETLAHALGKTSFLGAVAVTDSNFGDLIKKYLNLSEQTN